VGDERKPPLMEVFFICIPIYSFDFKLLLHINDY
jgi:hypothetical protein